MVFGSKAPPHISDEQAVYTTAMTIVQVVGMLSQFALAVAPD